MVQWVFNSDFRKIILFSLYSSILFYSFYSSSAQVHNVISGVDPGIGQGGAPASEAKSCWCNGVESCEWSELSAAGVQGS